MDTARKPKQLDIGADVVGSDGKKLGTVAYVVVRPPEMHLTDIVVSTGAILGREVVVPVDLIRDVVDGKVSLSIDKDELKQYPDYIEIKYREPPPGWLPPEDRYYWLAVPADTTGVRINILPGSLGIREGMEVESSDGHKVGSVDALDVDPATRDVKGLVVKEGLLFTRDTRLPVGDVQTIRDGKVILKLTKEQIQAIERAQSEGRD